MEMSQREVALLPPEARARRERLTLLRNTVSLRLFFSVLCSYIGECFSAARCQSVVLVLFLGPFFRVRSRCCCCYFGALFCGCSVCPFSLLLVVAFGVVLSCSSVAFGVLLALSCATRMSMEVSN